MDLPLLRFLTSKKFTEIFFPCKNSVLHSQLAISIDNKTLFMPIEFFRTFNQDITFELSI